MFSNITNIWGKELLDNIRDRKALLQALLLPLLIGVVYAVINPLLVSLITSRQEEPITVPVQGLNHADEALLEVFGRFDITLVPFDDDMATAIESGEEAAGLTIPAGFGQGIASEEAVFVTLLINPTVGGPFGGGISLQRIQLALTTYNQLVAIDRIQARELDPSLLVPVTLNTKDLSTSAQRAGLFAAFMLPILVGVLAAQGGMFIAIDVTAGEKERGTLESLLATPAKDVEIFVGKLAAVFTMTTVPIILTLTGFWLASNLLPDSMTNEGTLPLQVIINTILITLPLVLPINVMLMIISIRTKAFKDAQSSATPVILVCMFVSMAGAILPPGSTLLYLIPVYGTAALISVLAIGGIIPTYAVLFSVIGSVGAAVVGIGVGLRIFNRERLLYSM